MDRIVIGSRGSKLALFQSNLVKEKLRIALPNVDVSIKIIKTKGDKFLDMPLSSPTEKGLFTKEIEAEILNGGIDIAVHSLKDLPTINPDGIKIGAILERASVEDVLISDKKLKDLPPNAKVGTSSNRRAFQIKNRYPHLDIVPIRGNVDTRLSKFDKGEYDALVMARAGIERLGLQDRILEIIDTSIVVPAAGQGAIAVQVKSDCSKWLDSALSKIDDKTTRWEVETERLLLQRVGGGCAKPLGALCTKQGNEASIRAFYCDSNNVKSVNTNHRFFVDQRENAINNIIDLFMKICNV